MTNKYLLYGGIAAVAYLLWRQHQRQVAAATPTPTQSFISFMTQYGRMVAGAAGAARAPLSRRSVR